MVEGDVEVTVRPGFVSKRILRVTPERIEWGDRVIRLARVEHVALLELDRDIPSGDSPEFTVHVTYQGLWLADDQGEVTMSLKWYPYGRTWKQRQDRAARGARALEEVIFEVVAPRLTEARLSQIQRGDDVVIGGRQVIKTGVMRGGIPGWLARKKRQHAASTVVLNRHGIERRSRKGTEAEWPWSDIADATFHVDAIWLLARDQPVPLLAATYCDAILLPRLIRAALRWRGQ
jgi:hypothetical protein